MPGLQVGAEVTKVAEDGSWPIARFGDLRLGHGGFGARVDVSELRARGGTAGDVRAAAAMSPRRSSIMLSTLCAVAAYPRAPRASAMASAAWPSAAASASWPAARWMRPRSRNSAAPAGMFHNAGWSAA